MNSYDRKIEDLKKQIKELEKEKETYENNMLQFNESSKRWHGSNSFNKLLKEHTLEEYGIWKIYGEDPNADYFGSHSQPFLGKVEGKLIEVINYATKLHGFFQWGAGGEIRKSDKEEIKKL